MTFQRKISCETYATIKIPVLLDGDVALAIYNCITFSLAFGFNPGVCTHSAPKLEAFTELLKVKTDLENRKET